MVGHGGSGSTLAAMAAGLPLAVLPLFADQPQNADRVAELGAGMRLEGRPAEAVRELLDDPSYWLAAQRVCSWRSPRTRRSTTCRGSCEPRRRRCAPLSLCGVLLALLALALAAPAQADIRVYDVPSGTVRTFEDDLHRLDARRRRPARLTRRDGAPPDRPRRPGPSPPTPEPKALAGPLGHWIAVDFDHAALHAPDGRELARFRTSSGLGDTPDHAWTRDGTRLTVATDQGLWVVDTATGADARAPDGRDLPDRAGVRAGRLGGPDHPRTPRAARGRAVGARDPGVHVARSCCRPPRGARRAGSRSRRTTGSLVPGAAVDPRGDSAARPGALERRRRHAALLPRPARGLQRPGVRAGGRGAGRGAAGPRQARRARTRRSAVVPRRAAAGGRRRRRP